MMKRSRDLPLFYSFRGMKCSNEWDGLQAPALDLCQKTLPERVDFPYIETKPANEKGATPVSVRHTCSVIGLCGALMAALSSAAAQITITQADVESLAGKFQVSYPASDAAGFDLASSGPNRTWNLAAYSYSTTPNLRLTNLTFPPPGAPDVGNPAFAQANYATKSETPSGITWQYAKVSPAGVEVVGNIDTATSALSPGMKILGAFPAGYGQSWSSTSAASSPIIPTGLTASVSANGSLDSWGTMILPAPGGGTVSLGVLRLKLLQTLTLKIGIFPIYSISSTAYQWLASPSGGRFMAASASTDSLGNLRTLSYFTPFNEEPVAVAHQGEPLPASAALEPNYPNPFNPSTTIPFQIPSDGPASVTVYNALGQSVATLVKGTLTAGRHTATFDARGLPSGLYIVKLETPGFVATEKILLVR
jgi:hypothetical protein